MAIKLIRWYAYDMGDPYDGQWYLEGDDGHHYQIKAHCKKCALAEHVSGDPTADVDLRGLTAGFCGQFLAVLVRQNRDRARPPSPAPSVDTRAEYTTEEE